MSIRLGQAGPKPLRRVVPVGVLGNDDVAHRFVLAGFTHAVAAGDIPADRPEPTGGEECAPLFDADRPIGFATFYQPEGRSFIWHDLLWVDPRFRSRGGGRLLIDAVNDFAAVQGCAAVKFGTLVGNATMPIIAQMMGFEQQSVTFSKAIPQ